MMILLFLLIKLIVRKFDQPFLTKELKKFDEQANISLFIIFFLGFFSYCFDNIIIAILLMIIIVKVNMFFIIRGCGILFLFTLNGLSKTNSKNKILNYFYKKFESYKNFELMDK